MDGKDGKNVKPPGRPDRPVARPVAVGVGHPETAAAPWLMREKVAIPDRVAGYYHRPELMERVRHAGRRGTVLKAPGGFGKTTLLSEHCRRARQAGIAAGWLTLDIRDSRRFLEAHLVLAFKEAGLDVPGEAGDDDGPAPGNRIDGLLCAIAEYGERCVLVLDELERIEEPESLELVNRLVHWAPANLKVAIACRELPRGVDVASLVLSGHMALIDSDDLRFSSGEIAGFLGTRLPRRELRALVRASDGWPIAVRIARNERTGSATGSGFPDVAGNWIESRLWRGLDAHDRAFLLDIGLFDRMDDALVDEVLDGHGLIRRLKGMPALAGLLESVRVDASDSWRLHPLIREHCGERHRRENPGRYRSLHKRIAEALARRGETLTAMRHAARADAGDLAARILEDAGAMRLWYREGTGSLQSACRLLTPDITTRYPRLVLARCVVEMTMGQLDDARRTYQAAIEARPAPDSPGAREFEIDECTVRGMLCVYGSESLGSDFRKATLADYLRIVDEPDIDAALGASYAFGLCIGHTLSAEFDAALHWADEAERRLGESAYVRMCVELYRGQVAMARGPCRRGRGALCQCLPECVQPHAAGFGPGSVCRDRDAGTGPGNAPGGAPRAGACRHSGDAAHIRRPADRLCRRERHERRIDATQKGAGRGHRGDRYGL